MVDSKKGRPGRFFGRRPAATQEEETMPSKFGDRTPEQVQAALERAREARADKARLLKDIREGRVTLAEVLGDDYKGNLRAQMLPVQTLLRALPGVGIKTADAAMTDLGIEKSRRVRGLGVNQRARLLEKMSQ
jgi:hypothetical protein